MPLTALEKKLLGLLVQERIAEREVGVADIMLLAESTEQQRRAAVRAYAERALTRLRDQKTAAEAEVASVAKEITILEAYLAS